MDLLLESLVVFLSVKYKGWIYSFIVHLSVLFFLDLFFPLRFTVPKLDDFRIAVNESISLFNLVVPSSLCSSTFVFITLTEILLSVHSVSASWVADGKSLYVVFSCLQRKCMESCKC